MLQLLFLLNLFVFTRARSQDYWSGDFDTEKNCLQEKRIEELGNKKEGSQCTTETVSFHSTLPSRRAESTS